MLGCARLLDRSASQELVVATYRCLDSVCSELKDAVELLVLLVILSQQLAASENAEHDVPHAPATALSTADEKLSVGQPPASSSANGDVPPVCDNNTIPGEPLPSVPLVDSAATPSPAAPVNYAPAAGRIFAGLRAVQVVLNTAQVCSSRDTNSHACWYSMVSWFFADSCCGTVGSSFIDTIDAAMTQLKGSSF